MLQKMTISRTKDYDERRRRRRRRRRKTAAAVEKRSTICCLFFLLLLLLPPSAVKALLFGQPVQVFVLAGDDAAEGYASVVGLRELAADSNTSSLYQHLFEQQGSRGGDNDKDNDDDDDDDDNHVVVVNINKFMVRDDVYVTYDHYRSQPWQFGKLTIGVNGFGTAGSKFGPEVELGHVLGNVYTTSPVVIIKTAWPHRSLAKDFRPPASNLHEKDSRGSAGFQYFRILASVKRTLANLETVLTGHALRQYHKHGATMAGLVWFHGYSDLNHDEHAQQVVQEYEQHLDNLITDLRRELAPKAGTTRRHPHEFPIVIAELGGRGLNTTDKQELSFRKMQQRVVQAQNQQHKSGNDAGVIYCPTAKYVNTQLPAQGGYDFVQYYGRADTMISIGAAFASCLLEVKFKGKQEHISSTTGSTAASRTWSDRMASSAVVGTEMVFAILCLAACVTVGLAVKRGDGLSWQTLKDSYDNGALLSGGDSRVAKMLKLTVDEQQQEEDAPLFEEGEFVNGGEMPQMKLSNHRLSNGPPAAVTAAELSHSLGRYHGLDPKGNAPEEGAAPLSDSGQRALEFHSEFPVPKLGWNYRWRQFRAWLPNAPELPSQLRELPTRIREEIELANLRQKSFIIYSEYDTTTTTRQEPQHTTRLSRAPPPRGQQQSPRPQQQQQRPRPPPLLAAAATSRLLQQQPRRRGQQEQQQSPVPPPPPPLEQRPRRPPPPLAGDGGRQPQQQQQQAPRRLLSSAAAQQEQQLLLGPATTAPPPPPAQQQQEAQKLLSAQEQLPQPGAAAAAAAAAALPTDVQQPPLAQPTIAKMPPRAAPATKEQLQSAHVAAAPAKPAAMNGPTTRTQRHVPPNSDQPLKQPPTSTTTMNGNTRKPLLPPAAVSSSTPAKKSLNRPTPQAPPQQSSSHLAAQPQEQDAKNMSSTAAVAAGPSILLQEQQQQQPKAPTPQDTRQQQQHQPRPPAHNLNRTPPTSNRTLVVQPSRAQPPSAPSDNGQKPRPIGPNYRTPPGVSNRSLVRPAGSPPLGSSSRKKQQQQQQRGPTSPRAASGPLPGAPGRSQFVLQGAHAPPKPSPPAAGRPPPPQQRRPSGPYAPAFGHPLGVIPGAGPPHRQRRPPPNYHRQRPRPGRGMPPPPPPPGSMRQQQPARGPPPPPRRHPPPPQMMEPQFRIGRPGESGKTAAIPGTPQDMVADLQGEFAANVATIRGGIVANLPDEIMARLPVKLAAPPAAPGPPPKQRQKTGMTAPRSSTRRSTTMSAPTSVTRKAAGGKAPPQLADDAASISSTRSSSSTSSQKQQHARPTRSKLSKRQKAALKNRPKPDPLFTIGEADDGDETSSEKWEKKKKKKSDSSLMTPPKSTYFQRGPIPILKIEEEEAEAEEASPKPDLSKLIALVQNG